MQSKRITECFLFQPDGSLLLTLNNVLPTEQDIQSLSPHILKRFDLGVFQNKQYYCAALEQVVIIPILFQSLPLRNAFSFLNDERFGLAVKAYSVLNWDRNHQYCGRCGEPTYHKNKGFERVCAACDLSFFPRISPSIIVLIKKDNHLLMARSPHFAAGVYGLIAGFVEAGENLEEAVHREVQEEVGITIKNVSYCCSQPWPFPDSLMMGFTADYAGGDIVIDEEEIEAAGWYKYDDLPGRPSVAVSISTKLIDAFIADHNEC